MKPLRLRVQAFGPFAGSQEISFAELAAEGGLFLIHGHTGAGKTSLLDAICFALFGSSSGDERDGAGLRCDLADPSTPTEAELEFRLGDKDYRVTRSPDQKLKRKRGEGHKTERGDANLWTRPAPRDGSPPADWTPVASRTKEVTARVEELLGLGEKQFRQVVILPQGQFRAFLSASSPEREAILEALFRTADCRRLSEALKARFQALEQEVKGFAQSMQGRLKSLEAERIEDLAPMEAKLAEAADGAAAQRATATAALEAARRRRDLAKAVAAAQSELVQAEDGLRQLEEREQEAKAWLERKAASERARPVRSAIEGERAATRDRDAARDAHVAASAGLESARRLAQQAPELEALAQAQERDRVALGSKLAELESEAARIDRWKAACAAREAALRAKAEAEARSQASERKRAEAQRASEALETERDREAEKAARGEAMRAQLELLRGRAKAAQALVVARRELDAASALARSKEAERDRAAREAELAELSALQTKTKHFASLASALAARLAPGEPCPVCGSEAHPRPARAGDGAPSEEDVRAQEAAAARASRAATQAMAAYAEASAREGAARASAAQRATEVASSGDDAGEDAQAASALYDGLVAQGRRLAEEAKVAELAAKAAQELQAAALSARAALQRAEDSARVDSEGLRAAELASAQAESAVRALETELSIERLRDPSLARSEIESARERMERLRKAAEEARERASGSRRALAAAETAERERRGRLEEVETRLRAAREALETALRAAGFASADEAQAALLDGAEAADLDRRILERERKIAALTEARRRAKAELERLGPAPSDLEATERDFLDAESKAALATEGHATAVESLRRHQEQSRAILESAEGARASEAAYAVLGRLSNVAQGVGPENATGVNLQRYALGAKFDLVLDRASHRLRRMTRGQFALRRAAGREDLRRKAGLDIEVEDAHTGTYRPAASLSGGESFMAALALALGLADVVQEESGGVRFDAVFVDEGFGTLDSEALDLAMRTLADLKGATGRMVGVVSHVPELREQIERRLQVLRGERGSVARWNAS